MPRPFIQILNPSALGLQVGSQSHGSEHRPEMGPQAFIGKHLFGPFLGGRPYKFACALPEHSRRIVQGLLADAFDGTLGLEHIEGFAVGRQLDEPLGVNSRDVGSLGYLLTGSCGEAKRDYAVIVKVSAPRQPQAAAGDDPTLDLRGAGGDHSTEARHIGERELPL